MTLWALYVVVVVVVVVVLYVGVLLDSAKWSISMRSMWAN